MIRQFPMIVVLRFQVEESPPKRRKPGWVFRKTRKRVRLVAPAKCVTHAVGFGPAPKSPTQAKEAWVGHPSTRPGCARCVVSPCPRRLAEPSKSSGLLQDRL